MARGTARLSAVVLPKLKEGMHADGGGLYLQVTASGARTWIFRFMLHGRAREMGLGPLHIVTLSEAREKARECRKLRHEGIDPIEARKAKHAEERLAAATALTFRECADRYIEAHKGGWRNSKHAKQWPSTLEAYVYPVLGALPVQAVDVGLIMKVLEPIWHTKPETASRVRGRVETVLDWATARGYRRARTPLGGAVISISCSRPAARCGRSRIMQRYPMPRWGILSQACGNKKASPRGLWSS
jgi:hypothetical protein